MSQEKPDRRTLVTFLLDRTGAVENIRDQTITAFNAYLDTLKAGGNHIEFTLILFDSDGFDPVHICTPIRNVPNLERKTYVPCAWGARRHEASIPPIEMAIARRSIPLIDATWKSIAMVADFLQHRDNKPKVAICIQPSGMEGSSTEHSWDELRALIKDKAAQGWQFNFLGTGCTVYEQGTVMGIPASHIVACDRRREVDQGIVPATEQMCTMFTAAAHNTLAFARGAQANTGFSTQQKTDIGEQFVPVHPDHEASKERILFIRRTPIY